MWHFRFSVYISVPKYLKVYLDIFGIMKHGVEITLSQYYKLMSKNLLGLNSYSNQEI